ncbi:MAG: hypothetical protein NT062_09145 [Proteobacteria bacterium]|nr:hypothetical protein [Pseudomonadota bacterium]
MRTVISGDAIVNRDNLLRIKRFILDREQTRTYCQMFNNNPFFETARYEFYLHPDPGGPHTHPQWNINCDRARGDFNTMIVRRKSSRELSDDDAGDQYRKLAFAGDDVQVTDDYGDGPVDADQLMRFPRDAMSELLTILAGSMR